MYNLYRAMTEEVCLSPHVASYKALKRQTIRAVVAAQGEERKPKPSLLAGD